MDKIVESIKRYNPDETNYNDWQNKNSKIPVRKLVEFINDQKRSKK